jgi:hypothetical protein
MKAEKDAGRQTSKKAVKAAAMVATLKAELAEVRATPADDL